MKMLSLAALPLLSLSIVACTGDEVVDELAGETAADDVVDGKADAAVDGAYTFFTLQGDTRKCAFPMCGGQFLARVNRTSTVCHNGVSSDVCYTPELDFSESGLSEAAQDKLRATAAVAVFEGAARPLVRGRFAKKNLTTPRPEMGRFIVTEVWLPQGVNSGDEGVFVRIHDNGVRCIAAPCPSTGEKALNTSRSAAVSDINFAVSGIPEETVGELVNELFQPHGLIISGNRFNVKIDGRKGKGRTALNVWKRLVEQAECKPTGCSAEICADQDVFSTCEVKPEAVCFETATCERQGDGQCGWTSTPELDACLAQY
jgi:hypothetical protein